MGGGRERQAACQGLPHVPQRRRSSSGGEDLQTMQTPSPSQGRSAVAMAGFERRGKENVWSARFEREREREKRRAKLFEGLKIIGDYIRGVKGVFVISYSRFISFKPSPHLQLSF